MNQDEKGLACFNFCILNLISRLILPTRTPFGFTHAPLPLSIIAHQESPKCHLPVSLIPPKPSSDVLCPSLSFTASLLKNHLHPHHHHPRPHPPHHHPHHPHLLHPPHPSSPQASSHPTTHHPTPTPRPLQPQAHVS